MGKLISLGNELELAKERKVKVNVNGLEFEINCTPENLEELSVGLSITNFIPFIVETEVETENRIENKSRAEDKNKINCCVSKVKGKVKVRVKTKEKEEKKKIKVKIEELKESLKFLDVEEYKKTRGYHIAVAVFEGKAVARAYDVSRHYALAKVVGMCAIKGINLEKTYIVLSGRISKSIVEMCFNAGIPLIVSKAAIFDSAVNFCLENSISAVSFATGIAVGCAVDFEVDSY